MPAIGDTQMIWGIITFDATTNAPHAPEGTGNFTVARGGTGLFDVVFDDTVRFSSTPTVAVTQIYNGDTLSDFDPTDTFSGGSTLDNAVVIAVDTTKFRLITGDSGGHKKDRMFSFLVVGPGTQSVVDADKQVFYGNVGYNGDKLTWISHGGSSQLSQWGDEWIPASDVGNPGIPKPSAGTYGILPNWDVDNFAMVAQQIWAGTSHSTDITDFEFDGGSTLDNAVADSVSIEGGPNIITAGGSGGARDWRMLGFIAIGG